MPGPSARARQEGRKRAVAVPGQVRARSHRYRHQVRRALDPLSAPATTSRARLAELKRLKGNKPETAEAGDPHSLLLSGLPAQFFDRRAAGFARLRRHRLPLHGALDGPKYRRVHPDGRGGRQLDRRGAVLQDPARVPEPGRRHLHPLRQPGHPRGAGRRRQHHLQDPLQRRRGHDRRPERSMAA